jgi:ketol-acid reductoisomerase
MRIIMGFEVLVDNACDPELDYLDFKKEIKELMEDSEAHEKN